MATNDFLTFAAAAGSNVITQAVYAALAAQQTGFQAGVANSAQLNKVWRQSSIMAAVLAQFAADYSGQNSTDDGTTETLEGNLVAAIRSATKTSVILADTGAANAYTAVNVPPLVSGTWVDGVVQQVKIAHANTGASTYAPDGLAAIPIYGLGLQPLQGGELALNGTAVLMRLTIPGVNSGNPICVLMECAGGAQQVAPATQSQHALQLGQATGRLLRTTVYRNNAGTLQASVNGGAFANVSSTFAAQALTSAVDVEVQGAGGGSGGTTTCTASQVSQSGGGGAGAYGRGYFSSGFNGVTVTVGSAGVAGTVGSNGGNGGASSFGALITAPGGTGSTGSAASISTNFNGGGIGGSAGSGGYINSGGTYGTVGLNIGGTVGIGGNGGASVFGGGGTPQATTTGPGNVGPSYGAGAGGALTIPSGTGSVGSQGAYGVVIVREYA